MGQCRATTKKGDRCRREAKEMSRNCSMHEPAEEEVEAKSAWDDDMSDSAKTFLGLAVAAIVVCSFLVRGRF